jgi:hypothetical protein
MNVNRWCDVYGPVKMEKSRRGKDDLQRIESKLVVFRKVVSANEKRSCHAVPRPESPSTRQTKE